MKLKNDPFFDPSNLNLGPGCQCAWNRASGSVCNFFPYIEISGAVSNNDLNLNLNLVVVKLCFVQVADVDIMM